MIKKPLYKSVPTMRNYEDYISQYYTKGWNDAMDYIFPEAKEKRKKKKIKKNISIVKRIPKGGNMKDRYLFKAKTCSGEWVIGFLHCKDDKWYISNKAGSPFAFEIRPDTICQCTGLKDKNGKPIWENDILIAYLDDNYPQNATYEMVLWNKSGFCTKEQGSNDILEFCEFDQKYFEVCGNIFDNPEIFESEDNMTESEAIKELQENIDLPFGSNVSKEAAKMAIQALERQEKIKENMTESKAKTILETEIVHHPECSIFSEALSISIHALEKQIPYKPREYEDKYYSCKCGNVLLYKWKKYSRELTDKKMGLPYCLNCGQKLDWSDEEK